MKPSRTEVMDGVTCWHSSNQLLIDIARHLSTEGTRPFIGRTERTCVHDIDFRTIELWRARLAVPHPEESGQPGGHEIPGSFQSLTIQDPWQAGRLLCGEVKTLTCITKASFNNYKFAA